MACNPAPEVAPPKWTCFHCGETFTDPAEAEIHFGGGMYEDAGCVIKDGDERNLLARVREQEAELSRYREEDTDLHRKIAALDRIGWLRQEWRDIKDAPENVDVLGFGPHLGTLVVCYDPDARDPEWPWATLDGPNYRRGAFTHFMPLPAPPAEKDKSDNDLHS